MGCDSEETLHGFRAGCAITLALSGAELSKIMDHVGWSRRQTALYYLQLAIHNTREQSAKSRTSCKFSGDTSYAHSMVDVSQEVIINSGEHSHPTHSQISAKEEAGTAHPPHPFAENSWAS